MADYISLDELGEVIAKSMSGMAPEDYQYYNQLKNHRTILFNCEIDASILEKVILPLKEFEEDELDEPVNLILSSPGGDISEGLILMNIIDNYKKSLNIYVYSYACSLATTILCSGNNNPNVKKYCYPYTFFLFHGGSIQLIDHTNAAHDYMEFMNKRKAKIKEYTFKNTNITEEEWKLHEREEWYLDAETALEKKLIDEIIGVKTSAS